MRVVLVDWLGRGGIAQTSEAWVMELGAAGAEVTVVTRPGRELAATGAAARVVTSHEGGGRIRSHMRVVAVAAETIREVQPNVVIVQNYVLPPLERPVYRAAAGVGARVISVVHDHRLHSLLAGNRAGLRSSLRQATAVVAHTRFVADAVAAFTGRHDLVVVPHPVQVGMIDQPSSTTLLSNPKDGLLALHFGVLKRGYKGTEMIERLATNGVPGWSFAVLGAGAPPARPGLQSVPGFVDAGDLIAVVRSSQATLLPYRMASQSGAVVLGQVLGSVPVASAVGGIPEQIEHGRTGLLLPPDARETAWQDALSSLSDDGVRAPMVEAARETAWKNHHEFVAAIKGLVCGDA